MIVLASTLLSAAALAAPPVLQSPTRGVGTRHALRSEVLGEERELFVYLPNGYGWSERRYPLLVLPDARMNFTMTASVVHNLSEGGAIPRMIVVGIANTDRWRDLTPVPGLGIPGTGGGDAFLAFVTDELLPYVDANWRTNGFRIFAGHSLGGLMAVHALVEAPDAFDALVAISPSLEWGEGVLVERAVELLGEREELRRMLHLSIADERLERLYYDPLVAALEESAPKGLEWTSAVFEEEDDHMSVRATGTLAGIRWVFRDWRLTSNRIFAMSDDELEEHFERATRRYGERRSLGLMDVTNAGYWGLYDPATVERAMEFFHRAIVQWPESAYARSCLGEGLERTGRPEEALVEMERALEMARASGEADLAYYEGMVSRVRGALGR